MSFSLSSLLGIDASVDKTQAAVAELLDQKVGPLVQVIENRFEGIIATAFAQLNGAKLKVVDGGLQLELTPIPKATAVDTIGQS